ncbi:RagB/SusD family nutrient uptake outer membrane protein [Hymenobacter sp. BT559]|uniref:RagB/SusD family nutrient uptake outer membrane protein n=1 Tax=Hymenobacter sp. BT559 TaxID=2795729 RepID=UPI0018EA32F0|nr:RagB/SusD family nutrient uptake outer membrane protein [Hymenobacter sp. BT559]MBJ6145214.1 RagB/SusD family nutrient uptake outer membrane protein [Hymenobacter sp. BT559]
MNLFTIRQLATRSALLLTLGLTAGSCEKAINVEPSNSVSSDTGFTTKEDAAAGLLGAYDAVQSSDYAGLAFPTISDLISGDISFRGTFTTTYGVIAQNLASPDNTQISNTWNAIYVGINRANYLIQQSELINDPAFAKQSTIAQARALRAFHYMNLLALWGGTPQGYGYPNGLGVPLRLTPTTSIGTETEAIPRATEAAVAEAIRADLDYAIANLAVGSGTRITKSAALALRARFELRMRQYADALKFAQQVPVVANFSSATIGAGSAATDVLWQLAFNNTDQSQYAFYWYPSPGGRDEFDPGTAISAAHPTGDRRLAINVLTSSTTAKYTQTANRDDPFNAVRYAEVVLTIAEAAAQTGDIATATTNLNIIRSRAGLANTTATTAAGLVTDILLQRRLEFAYEGMYWYDLRRTNTVQIARPTYQELYRNLFPLPLREVQLTNGLVITQNPGY